MTAHQQQARTAACFAKTYQPPRFEKLAAASGASRQRAKMALAQRAANKTTSAAYQITAKSAGRK
jgi:hypothetical protein